MILYTPLRSLMQNKNESLNPQNTIPGPNGRAIGVFCENFRENWPRYIGTALYIVITATYPRGQWVTVCCDRSWPTLDCFNGPRRSGLRKSLSRPTLEGTDCEPGNDDNLRKVRIVGNPVTTLSVVVNCQLKTCNSFFVGMLRYIGGLVQGCSYCGFALSHRYALS